jgi:hypothetical protein
MMKATITADVRQTRVLVQDESGDRLVARLPPLISSAHPRAITTLLEALALWCGKPVPVVLCVDEPCDWELSGLTEAFGFGTETLFHYVQVVPRRGEHPERLTELGSFDEERAAARRQG